MGTFTVAAQRAGAFPADRREMLGVIANQVAISLQNGCMVEALEEKALFRPLPPRRSAKPKVRQNE